jgi:hypothetical protein
VLFGLDKETIDAMFAQAPAAVPLMVWQGPVTSIRAGSEMIPLRFDELDFIIAYQDPLLEAGDEDGLLSMCENWAGGFLPDRDSRLIKFFRVDATLLEAQGMPESDSGLPIAFNPKHWGLKRPEKIFTLTDVIAEAMTYHCKTFPDCTQYFYWPATQELESLYKRVFQKVERRWMPGAFQRILGGLGEFYGYQRT